MQLPAIEPYKIKMVEKIFSSSKEERIDWINKASWNLFNLTSEQVIIDLLTDSGTGAMSDNQWSAIMTGDESYAGSSSYYRLKETIEDLTGFRFFLPCHQGRAAENVLFSTIVKEGDTVPGNSHFDTTKGHIEFRKAKAVDCPLDIISDITASHPFKGNVDLRKLENVLRSKPSGKVPLILITITNNTSGGQPVSMENIRSASRLAKKYSTRLFLDSARFAENAYFIKTREDGYANKNIREITREMFSYADGMTMSSKKDGIVNIGGFIGFREEELFKKASMFNIMYEGFNTYGGMAGRDMNALARGLNEATEFSYLESRINQVARLGTRLAGYGIPVLKPFGGHAIFIDALKFLPEIPREEFTAQTLATEVYIEGGVRTAEIGTLMADRDPLTRKNRYPSMEMIRLAIPRRVYTDNHLDYSAAVINNVYERRREIKRGLNIVLEAPIMRHFTIELAKL